MKWILSSPTRFYGSVFVALSLAFVLAVGAASLRIASFDAVEETPTATAKAPGLARGDAEIIRRLRPAIEVAEEAYPEGTSTVMAVEGPTSIVDVVTATETCSLVIARGEIEETTCLPS